jgi:putative Mn2+ efflux pump MntP
MRYSLSLLFGVCDGLSAYLGATLVHVDLDSMPWAHNMGPILVAAYAVYVLALASNAQAIVRSRPLLFVLPVLLSLDNFAEGTVLAQQGLPVGEAAIAMVLVSGIMALAGMTLGSALANLWRVPRPVVAGSGLIAAALLLLFT